MSEQLHLFDQLGYDEDSRVEFKSAKGGFPLSVWETYSAFANTNGGTIWLGIAQRDGKPDIHGVPDVEKWRKELWDQAGNRNKVSLNLLQNNDVTVVERDGHKVIRIEVPRADRRQRPVYVGQNPNTGTYRRNHEGDARCTEDEVRRMFSDGAVEPADSKLPEHFGMDDIHPESLRRFRTLFTGAKPGHPWAVDDDKALLIRLGGWRKDRATGSEGLTVAGLLMFGKAESIRDPHAVPEFHLDYREHFSDNPAIRWTDRLTIDGTWEGNLFEFYRQVMQKLSIGPGVKAPFQRDEAGYRRSGTPVHEALQEALVNALIHGDYRGQGGVVIDRYPDRIVFTNPGTLLLSREQLLTGGVSECRNKSLQLMFQMLGAGDKAGSGIAKIRDSWAAEHWQSPSLGETIKPDRVVLDLPMISTLPTEVLEALKTRFGEATLGALEPDAVQALVLAEVEGRVTNNRLQGMLTRHRVDITEMLGDLVERGLLRQEGTGRGAYYLPVLMEADAAALGSAPRIPGNLPPNPGTSDARTGMPEGQTRDASGKTGGAGPQTCDALAAKPGNLGRQTREPCPAKPGNPAPPNLRTSEARIADFVSLVKSASKSDPETIRQAILSLCTEQFVSREQLAGLLDRNAAYIHETYLRPLLGEGLLERLHPDKPNHPDQAYRTVGKRDSAPNPVDAPRA